MDNIRTSINLDIMARTNTLSSYTITEDIEKDLDSILTTLQTYYPNCRVYTAVTCRGINDGKMFVESRVRRDLKKFMENPTRSIVVEWAHL